MDLLAAEITARHREGSRASTIRELAAKFGTPSYTRIDAPATPEQKARLKKLSPESVAGVDARGRADHGEAHERARATAPRSAASRW